MSSKALALFDPLTTLPIWVFSLVFLLFLFTAILFQNYFTNYHLPPGPPPLPILGNIRSLPRSNLYIYLTQLSQTYGPFFPIFLPSLRPKPTIIISSPTIAQTLLSTRGTKYSSRPRSVVFGEIYGASSSMVVMPYGTAWSLRRRAMHAALKPSVLGGYKPTQSAEASKFMFEILRLSSSGTIPGGKDPEEEPGWSVQIDRFLASILISIGYGHRLDSMDEVVAQRRMEFLHYINGLAKPGRFLADTLPWMAKLPDFIVPWKREVREKGEEEWRLNARMLDVIRSEMEISEVAPEQGKEGEEETSGRGRVGSVAATMLFMKAHDPALATISARSLAHAPTTVFSAGLETSSSTLHSAILLLLAYPQVLDRLQAELSTAVPCTLNRSPGFDDRENLPYCSAFIKEILRFRPPVPLVVPRSTTEEDVYEGWKIAKGTTVIVNGWAINHDQKYFPDPDSFLPQRYLPNTHLLFDPALVGETFPSAAWDNASFGFGRRACPGAELAMNSVFIAVVKLLWGFEVLRPDNAVGVVDINSYVGGLALKPARFEAVFKVRSAKHREIIEREMTEAEEVLAVLPLFDSKDW